MVTVHDLAVFEDDGRDFSRSVTLRRRQTCRFKVDYRYNVQNSLPKHFNSHFIGAYCLICQWVEKVLSGEPDYFCIVELP